MAQNFMQRARSVLGASAFPDLSRLERANDRHLNQTADSLVKQFHEQHDNQAFQLLVDLTAERLAQSSTGIAHDLSLGENSDRLVINVLEKLVVDVRPPPDAASSFSSDTTPRMRDDVEAWIRDITLSSVHDPDEAAASEIGSQEPLIDMNDPKARTRQVSLHRLDPEFRQALKARHVDYMDTVEITEPLAVPSAYADSLVVEATRHLQWAVDVEPVQRRECSGPRESGPQPLSRFANEVARMCLLIGRHQKGPASPRTTRWYVEPQDACHTKRRLILARVRAEAEGDANGDRLSPGNPLQSEAGSRPPQDMELDGPLKGCTARAVFLRSELIGVEHRPSSAIRPKRSQLARSLSSFWRSLILENLRSSVIQLHRFWDFVDLQESLLDRDPGRATSPVNVLTAHAWIRNEPQIDVAMERFRRPLAGIPDPIHWHDLIAKNGPWIAKQMRREAGGDFRSHEGYAS